MKTVHALIGGVALSIGLAANAGEMGTPDEAKALSEKAAAWVNQVGDVAFVTFGAEEGGFITKDLYVFCMDMEGKMLSHAKKPHLVGKNLIDFKKYGDLLFQDMIAVAKNPGSGWVDYRWPYPGTDEVRQKTSYIIKNNEGFFCGVGAYK